MIFPLAFMAIAFLFNSCSKAEEICNCTKETYLIETISTTGSNGLPHLSTQKTILYEEVVSCQDERKGTKAGENIYFDIKCN